MSKRESESEFEGPLMKMKREEADDGGASARSGRVRKKSAKVLEMEEFEQVEKTQHITKKGRTPKVGGGKFSTEEHDIMSDKTVPVVKKLKASKSPAVSNLLTAFDGTPVTSKPVKSELTAHLAKPVQQFVPVQTSGILTTGLTSNTLLSHTDIMAATMKQEYDADLSLIPDLAYQQQLLQHSPVRSDDQKSVIKYLLSSPSSGSKLPVGTGVLPSMAASAMPSPDLPSAGKKSAKQSAKTQNKATVKKPKKVKTEIMSPTHSMDLLTTDQIGSGLKMKILSSRDPSAAQVTMNMQAIPSLSALPELTTPVKQKKHKKIKEETQQGLFDGADVLGLAQLEGTDLLDATVKKPKKVSKKKEKLIQDAISAAQQMPNLAALVASQTHLSGQSPGHLGGQVTLSLSGQKPPKLQKKKLKTTSPLSMSASSSDDPNDSLGKSDASFGDDGEETHLVIAETEKRRKKSFGKKKDLAHREKAGSVSPKGEKSDKKLSKRAPTAYMLFCNTYRPNIVNENPGIEFAGISRKLGEMWQTLSNKQKLQWRRKAQRRRKKGSNLISTGKSGKEINTSTLTPTSSSKAHPGSGLKLSTVIQKAQRSSPEDTPQSPTKNFSIEPIDVAAHLKLLGESLSIIGMRLQEHKGMIAVQGSLSVLLDSLLCACGPLLCLTQQVPGMDGCSPLVHAQTLDSVAYIMPGL